MIRRTLIALALAASVTACAAEPSDAAKAPAAAPTPGDAAIVAALQSLAPGMEIGRIGDSPIPGYREVAIGARVVYVSEDGKRLIQGNVLDLATRESLTQASEAVLRKDMIAAYGDDSRITFAAANPKHEITVFTDIDCGFCRRMHQEIAEYNRLGITVNYLFYPRAGLGSESFQKAVDVWCAPDRRKAMTDAKAGRPVPTAAAGCVNPVTRDYELGRRIGLDGTPAVYAADGTQLGGYVAPAEMITRLDELAAKAAR